MKVPFSIIIPARYASTRLPGKPLLDINGKPLIQHVFETAIASDAKQVVIATDDERIAQAAESFGASVVLTSVEHQSGTDRVAEAVVELELDADDIVVNLQGDEFSLPVSLLNQVATNLYEHPEKKMATLCEVISSMDEYTDPNVVKVLFDKHNTALYFSRSPIPANRGAGVPSEVFRHIGLYAYRAGFLQEFTQLPVCQMEQAEALEQLRALFNGAEIHVEVAMDATGIGIDTLDDLELARASRTTV